MSHVEEAEHTPKSQAPAPAKPRNKLLAAILALFIPGLGHLFVGHTLRGIAWGLSPFVFVIVCLATGGSEPSPTSLLKTLIAMVLAAYLGSLIDVLIIPSAKHRATNVPALVLYAVVMVIDVPVMAVGLRAFVIEAFKVPSGAMVPTIQVGDHLFTDKAVYRRRAPKRGEVMVFAFPERPEQDFIKRVIAVPGDTLVVKDGHTIINGWEAPSCRVGKYTYTDEFASSTSGASGESHEGELFIEYLEESAYFVFLDSQALSSSTPQGPYTVKEGEYWVLGDNRNNSHDSRMWFGGNGGGVPTHNIRGRARTIWLSMNSNNRGVDLAQAPTAPTPALKASVDTCLAKRPTTKDATPPHR